MQGQKELQKIKRQSYGFLEIRQVRKKREKIEASGQLISKSA
jgi:hypothetical protein